MSLKDKLIVGAKVKLGELYCLDNNWDGEREITLIKGFFEEDNGLYCETRTAPSIFDEETREYTSIYHLFGNDFEFFNDCEVID